MADTDSLELKKRARRRLVGSAALALLAAIVLPMAMDHEPADLQQDVQIHIPQQGSGPYADKPEAAAEAAEAEPPVPAESQVESATPPGLPAPPKPAVAAQPKPLKPEPRPEALKPETRPAPSEAARARALLEGREPPVAVAAAPQPAAPAASAFVVQLGAYRDAANAGSIKDRARAAGFGAYTETVGGTVRVRVGPFASREAADAAAERLRRQGFSSVVSPR